MQKALAVLGIVLFLGLQVGAARAEKWGAISCGLWRNSRGVAQVAVGSAFRNTEAEAGAAALAQCRAAGGQACQIEGKGAFDHGCGYIVAAHDNAGMVWCTSEPTKEAVLAKCASTGRICKQPIGGCVDQ